MTSLKSLIINSVNNSLFTDNIQTLIDKHVSQLIESIIGSVFSKYSSFGTALHDKISRQVELAIDNITLPSYNDIVVKTVTSVVNDTMRQYGQELLANQLQDILQPMKQFSLSELGEFIIREYSNEALSEQWIAPTIIIEYSKYSDNKDTYHIYIDGEPNIEKYRCKYSMFVAANKISSVTVYQTKLDNQLFLGLNYNLERVFLQMYLSKPAFKIDIDLEDIVYINEDQ